MEAKTFPVLCSSLARAEQADQRPSFLSSIPFSDSLHQAATAALLFSAARASSSSSSCFCPANKTAAAEHPAPHSRRAQLGLCPGKLLTGASSTTPCDLLPLRQAVAARTPTTLLAMTLPSSPTTRSTKCASSVISYSTPSCTCPLGAWHRC